ncbi:uncharacterized protein [Palaemon carinicauda]|uniref:uncharacterized protein n=1 Tax=Palaemon carinicauda TaxID=392227 RepID=UPI0035B571A1
MSADPTPTVRSPSSMNRARPPTWSGSRRLAPCATTSQRSCLMMMLMRMLSGPPNPASGPGCQGLEETPPPAALISLTVTWPPVFFQAPPQRRYFSPSRSHD